MDANILSRESMDGVKYALFHMASASHFAAPGLDMGIRQAVSARQGSMGANGTDPHNPGSDSSE